MITRACISINNRCNLNCTYCHFHEKKEFITKQEYDICQVLDNIIIHIKKHDLTNFKLGFVGNGEPLLDYSSLKEYIFRISEYLKDGRIAAYIITNGLLIDEEKLLFFKENKVNVSFSIDGIADIHDKYRCGSHEKVSKKINLYKKIFGKNPPMNCTVGKEHLQRIEETIDFFSQFDSRITFSRMIGKYGISLDEFHRFMEKVKPRLNVRTGGYDCTMYGGLCGAGLDNVFYANGYVYLCGNCIDLPFKFPACTALDNITFDIKDFDRTKCYKEISK